MNFKYNDINIPINIKFSNRKTLCLKIDSGLLCVYSPLSLQKEYIQKFINDKSYWIISKLDIFYQKERKTLEHGEKLLFLGEEHFLNIQINQTIKKTKIYIEYQKIHVEIRSMETIKKDIENWYKKIAFDVILERVRIYEKFFPKINKITIKNHRTKWGSCSTNKNISFNYKIILAPIEILDYVIVHEMSHLFYMDHSSDFWGKVSEILGDYKTRKIGLKKFEKSLYFIN